MMSSASHFSLDKQFLIELSYSLTKDDSARIAYLEGLPQELGEQTPLRVLEYLQMRGRASRSNLVQILEGIKKHDVAQKIAISFDENAVITKARANALSAQIKYLMTLAKGTKKESTVAAITECMDQLNQELRKLSIPDSDTCMSYRRRYCPSDDELHYCSPTTQINRLA